MLLALGTAGPPENEGGRFQAPCRVGMHHADCQLQSLPHMVARLWQPGLHHQSEGGKTFLRGPDQAPEKEGKMLVFGILYHARQDNYLCARHGSILLHSQQEFKVILRYTASSRPAWATISPCLKQRNNQKKRMQMMCRIDSIIQ